MHTNIPPFNAAQNIAGWDQTREEEISSMMLLI